MWDCRRVDSYPKEIETALYGHEGVLEVAVVAAPTTCSARSSSPM
jgi:acyl-CoA synthetase (AMP-forming)/AMP-acid ligase II